MGFNIMGMPFDELTGKCAYSVDNVRGMERMLPDLMSAALGMDVRQSTKWHALGKRRPIGVILYANV